MTGLWGRARSRRRRSRERIDQEKESKEGQGWCKNKYEETEDKCEGGISGVSKENEGKWVKSKKKEFYEKQGKEVSGRTEVSARISTRGRRTIHEEEE